MRIIIPELESADERWVRIRDECMHIIRFPPSEDAKQDAKRRLKEAFLEWWETL